MFGGCKSSNTLIISKDANVEARRGKTLEAHENSLGLNFIPIDARGQGVP
jgi:hypothetical protein